MSEITTYTNVFSEQDRDKIWSFLRSDNWSFGQNSNPQSIKRFWSMDFSKNKFFTEHLFGIIKNVIGDKYSLERVYANGQTYGLDGEIHQDASDDYSYTFLYYPSKEWRVEWGGFTLVYDGSHVRTFLPGPNTAIMFPGKYFHCGEGPTREFYDLRISIAYKLRLSPDT